MIRSRALGSRRLNFLTIFARFHARIHSEGEQWARPNSSALNPTPTSGPSVISTNGKTTLTAAIHQGARIEEARQLRRIRSDRQGAEERERGITIAIAHVEYETTKRHYAHVDCPDMPITSRT